MKKASLRDRNRRRIAHAMSLKRWDRCLLECALLMLVLVTTGCVGLESGRTGTHEPAIGHQEILYVSTTGSDLGLELEIDGRRMEIRTYRILPDGAGREAVESYSRAAGALQHTGLSMPGVLRWLAFGNGDGAIEPHERVDATQIPASLREWRVPEDQDSHSSLRMLSVVRETHTTRDQSRLPWYAWILIDPTGRVMRVRDAEPSGTSGQIPTGYVTPPPVVDSVLTVGPNTVFLLELLSAY